MSKPLTPRGATTGVVGWTLTIDLKSPDYFGAAALVFRMYRRSFPKSGFIRDVFDRIGIFTLLRGCGNPAAVLGKNQINLQFDDWHFTA
jgi:hypothetical protein